MKLSENVGIIVAIVRLQMTPIDRNPLKIDGGRLILRITSSTACRKGNDSRAKFMLELSNEGELIIIMKTIPFVVLKLSLND